MVVQNIILKHYSKSFFGRYNYIYHYSYGFDILEQVDNEATPKVTHKKRIKL